jgi:hypothetical protein
VKQKHRRILHEDGGRNWSHASISHRTLKILNGIDSLDIHRGPKRFLRIIPTWIEKDINGTE